MAKKRARALIGFVCTECGQLNYVSEKNKLNTPAKLELDKFCNNKDCRAVKTHKETTDLD
jgi:large subunit ribosomal protein L33